MEVRVDGLEELGKALATFPDILGKKYLARATFTAAAQIETKAISNFNGAAKYQAAMQLIAQNVAIFKRKDDPNTAHYAIGVRRVKVSSKVKKVLRILRRAGQPIQIANDPFWWWWFEKGTAERIVKKTGQHVGKIDAQPCLRPAFETEKENALEVFRTMLADGVIAAAAEASGK